MMKLLIVATVTLFFVADTMCRSTTVRRFLDVNCDEKINCTEEHVPVCGTDGRTYGNKCLVDMENQKKTCVEGDFNPVVIVHDGPCVDTAQPIVDTTPATR